MITAGLLLAAGLSRRFGATDKLLCPLGGPPLIAHAAAALRGTGFTRLVAVVSDGDVAKELIGFDCVSLQGDPPSHGLSLRTGIGHLRETGVDKVVIVLGDMPFVTPELLRDVAARCTAATPSATTDGHRTLPPACFPARHFDALSAVTGDRGAARLLNGLDPAQLARATAREVHDIDTTKDLETAQRWLSILP
jgi:CTP:molybdopterin cytidylyltransferase MocA